MAVPILYHNTRTKYLAQIIVQRNKYQYSSYLVVIDLSITKIEPSLKKNFLVVLLADCLGKFGDIVTSKQELMNAHNIRKVPRHSICTTLKIAYYSRLAFRDSCKFFQRFLLYSFFSYYQKLLFPFDLLQLNVVCSVFLVVSSNYFSANSLCPNSEFFFYHSILKMLI